MPEDSSYKEDNKEDNKKENDMNEKTANADEIAANEHSCRDNAGNNNSDGKGKVTKDMKIGEIVAHFPEAINLMMEAGLHCVGCHVAAYETLEEGAKAHGLSDEEIKSLVDSINKKIGNKG